MRNRRFVGFRASGYTPRLSLIALLLAILSVLLTIFLNSTNKVHETYTARTLRVENGTVYETEFKKEITRKAKANELNVTAGISLELQEMTEEALTETAQVTAEVKEAENTVVASQIVEKHFPESTYIKGAIMLTGEAGGVPSRTEQSGCLWTACNRVDSSDPFYPNDLEAVIEQACQFDGYKSDGTYTEECYELAVDVFERWWREKHGESAESVGRTLPIDYLFFTGDGSHNYFTKTQNDGQSYEWGSVYASPYET